MCYMALVLFCLLGDVFVTQPAFHLLCFFLSLLVLPEDDTSHNLSQARASSLSGSSLRQPALAASSLVATSYCHRDY